MSHDDFRSESRTIEGTAGSEKVRQVRGSQSVPDTRREQREKSGTRPARHFPRGSAILSLLWPRKRSAEIGNPGGSDELSGTCLELGPRTRRVCQRRFGESLRGSRRSLKPATSQRRGRSCRRGLIRDHCVGKRLLGRSMVDVGSASFGGPKRMPRADFPGPCGRSRDQPGRARSAVRSSRATAGRRSR